MARQRALHRVGLGLVVGCSACGDAGGGGGSQSGTSSGDTGSSSVGTSTSSGPGGPTESGSGGASVGQTTGSGSAGETLTGSSGATMAAGQCGDGAVDGVEACDDGNMVAGDGCEPDCTLTPSVCGDGVIGAGEACDDGNTEDGDGCSGDCKESMPPAECGDGVVQAPEACDDGNDLAGDGCEPDCTISPPLCGNGALDPGEECDDGNMVDGGPMDGCKNDCTAYFPPGCMAPAAYANCDANIDLADKADKKNALRAIGVCDLQPSNSIITTAFEFDPLAKPATWQVAKGYGTYLIDHDNDPNTPMQLVYSPREGSAFLMLSSGSITLPNNMGVVVEDVNSQVTNGDNGNSDGDALPSPFSVTKGSNGGLGGTPFKDCDGVDDCSDTLQDQWTLGGTDPNDRVYFTFKTKVPAGTKGYTFDFVFCSAEWPDWVDTGFNDLLIAYQVDPTPDAPMIDPYTGNVTFIPDPNDDTKGLPLTITALDPYFQGPGYTFDEPQLKGTGFEQHACSGWFQAKGGVQPGAEVTIGFYLADMSDSILATVALLDNFRWDCQGCVPSEVDDCGVQQPM